MGENSVKGYEEHDFSKKLSSPGDSLQPGMVKVPSSNLVASRNIFVFITTFGLNISLNIILYFQFQQNLLSVISHG